MEWQAPIVEKLAIPVVVLWVLTSLLNADIVDELVDRLAIELGPDLIEVSTTRLQRLVEDLLIGVHIVILPVLLQAVRLLRTEANLCVDEHWVTNFDEASIRARLC